MLSTLLLCCGYTSPATTGPDAGVGCLDLKLICFPTACQALIAEARAGADGAELQGGDVSWLRVCFITANAAWERAHIALHLHGIKKAMTPLA